MDSSAPAITLIENIFELKALNYFFSWLNNALFLCQFSSPQPWKQLPFFRRFIEVPFLNNFLLSVKSNPELLKVCFRSVIGPKKLAPLSEPTDAKLKSLRFGPSVAIPGFQLVLVLITALNRRLL